MAFDKTGGVFVGLDYSGTITLGGVATQNVCTTGTFRRDMVIVKMAPGGSHAWSRSFACAEGMVMTSDRQGGVLAAGALATPADLGTGLLKPNGLDRDLFAMRVDGEGATLWSAVFPAANDQRVSGIATDPDGGIVLVGGFQHTFELGSGVMRGDGGARFNLFVARLDGDGKPVWGKGFPTDLWQGPAIAVDADGNIVVAASMRGGPADLGAGPVGEEGGLLVAKLDRGGALLWSRAFGAKSDAVHGVAVDRAGAIVLAGETAGSIDFGGGAIGEGSTDATDPFVVKLDPTGAHLWSRRFGAPRYGVLASGAQATQVATDAAGHVYVAGKILDGTVDLGGGPLGSDAGNFIGKLDAAGAYVWSTHLTKRERSDPSHHHLVVRPGGALAITGDVTRRDPTGGSIYGLFVGVLAP